MKTFYTACLALLLYSSASAQSNFHQFSLGGGYGMTQSFTEVKGHGTEFSGYITGDYYFTPFLSLGLEAQKGRIFGGNDKARPDNREFLNTYKAVTINGKIAYGEIFDYGREGFARTIRGLYVGVGVGAIKNKMRYVILQGPEIEPEKEETGTPPAPAAPVPPVDTEEPKKPERVVYHTKKNSTNLLVPINLGINFYFTDHYEHVRYIINFNYQGNITFGEGLDGYDNASTTLKSKGPDIYTYVSVGVKYQFGPMGLFRKRIL